MGITEHAKLMPSSAGVTIECAGSVQAQERYPQEETDDTKEGNATHWVAASALGEYLKPLGGVILTSQYIGQIAPNGVIITEEMVEAAYEYVFDVLKTCNAYGLLQSLRIEQRTKSGIIHDLNWGTPDCSAYHSAGNTLYLWDFKYGHRYVDVYECWQLLNYAILLTDGLRDTTNIVMRIVQPRCFSAAPVREWSITVGELRPYRNKLEMAFDEALSDNPTIKSGSHCRDCTARHACKAAHRAAEAAIDCAYNLVDGIRELDNEALGTALSILNRASDAIDLMKSGLEQDVLTRIKQGKQVPGWEAKQGKGRTIWNRPAAEIIQLGKMFDIELKKPDEAITPNQAAKKGIDAAVITAYSQTPNTGLKLVKDDGTKAARVFKQPRG